MGSALTHSFAYLSIMQRLFRAFLTGVLFLFCLGNTHELKSQNYSGLGLQFMIPDGRFNSATGDGWGIGFFGNNRFFVNDWLNINGEGSLFLLFEQGNLDGQLIGLNVGPEFFLKPEGALFRPYAGSQMGLDLYTGTAFFQVSPQAGVLMEIGDITSLEFGLRYRLMFGVVEMGAMEFRLGLTMNLDYF